MSGLMSVAGATEVTAARAEECGRLNEGDRSRGRQRLFCHKITNKEQRCIAKVSADVTRNERGDKKGLTASTTKRQ